MRAPSWTRKSVCQLVNSMKLINTLAILRGSFGNFRPLFDYSFWLLNHYFGLRQSSFQLTITSNARNREHLKAFANSCKHYKINEHSRNTSGVLSVTFGYSLTTLWLLIDYFGLRQSSFKLTITSNGRYREHLKAFANCCEHYKK